MRRTLLLITLTLSLLALPSMASAQTMKLGVVDFQAALNDVEEGKKARKVLETRFEEKRMGLEARRTELETMRENLEAQKALLSEDALRGKEAEFNTLAVEFQQDMVEAQQEMALMEQELTGGILEKLLNVAQAIGKEQGYTLIVEAQAVVFADDSLDITSQVIARFNTK
ncbi:MAG: OmpH family outer membrane protein [Deltaproteobacteria bacterium]|nr:OmpH family outer membrane protein [Deltaproteobacteria bacterium]